MYCVRTSTSKEEIIKKSRFIGYLFPCASIDEIQAALNGLAREHSGATHIAFAFRIKTPAGFVSRFSDAGEPQGTAGKPIFQHIEGRDLINCLVAVVRYFGGIKLGAGGLTRAYGNAARGVIEISSLTPFVEYKTAHVRVDYPQLASLEYHLNNWGGRIESRSYSDHVELVISLPESSVGELEKLLARKGSG